MRVSPCSPSVTVEVPSRSEGVVGSRRVPGFPPVVCPRTRTDQSKGRRRTQRKPQGHRRHPGTQGRKQGVSSGTCHGPTAELLSSVPTLQWTSSLRRHVLGGPRPPPHPPPVCPCGVPRRQRNGDFVSIGTKCRVSPISRYISRTVRLRGMYNRQYP